MTFRKIHFYRFNFFTPLNLNKSINKFYVFMNKNKFINMCESVKFGFKDSFEFNKNNYVDLIHCHSNKFKRKFICDVVVVEHFTFWILPIFFFNCVVLAAILIFIYFLLQTHADKIELVKLFYNYYLFIIWNIFSDIFKN